MKETKKAIPFLLAVCTVVALFYLNPAEEAHFAKIKAEYVDSNPKTWRATWWTYERSLERHDYFFFSVVKRKNRPRSIGVAGVVATIDER